MSQEIHSREIQKIKDSEKVKEFVNKTVGEVLRDDKDRQIYLNKIVNAYNQRVGNKKESDLPWPGAANIAMPFTDKIIRKFKPSLVLSLWNPRKLANVKVEQGTDDPKDQSTMAIDPNTQQPIPGSGKGIFEQRADRAELALNYFLRKKMDLLEQLNIGVDYFLEKGRVYFKIYEDFKTVVKNKILRVYDFKEAFGEEYIKAIKRLDIPEIVELLGTQGGFEFDMEDEEHRVILYDVAKKFKSGEEEIQFDLKVLESRPFIMAVPPEQVIVPSDSRRKVEDLSRITHEFYMNEYELRSAVDSGQFNREIVEKQIAKKGTTDFYNDYLQAQQRDDEGVSEDTEGRWKIWEIHTYWKSPGSKQMEKWVLTTFAEDNSSEFLRLIREPNDDNEFPFIAHDNEIRADRALNSRGIPEMLYDVQETIDKMESNRINRDTVQNVPMFTVKRSANMDSQSIQFIPGEGILVDNHDDIQPFNPVKGVDISTERIESIVKAYGEEFVGSIDFAFGNRANVARGAGAKTLGEIQIAQGEAQKIANLDMMMLQDTFTKIYTRVFKLLRERFCGKLKIKDKVITKQDFNFPFEVTANGTIEDSDRMFKAQKILNRMQVQSFQDPSYVTIEDRYNAYVEFLEQDGVNDPDVYSTNPTEVLGQRITQMQQQLQQLNGQAQLLMDNLQTREKELAQVEEKTRRAVNKYEIKRNVVNNKVSDVKQISIKEE